MILEKVRIVEFVIGFIAVTAFLLWYLPRAWFRSVVGVVTVTLFAMLFTLLGLGVVRLGFALAGYPDYAGREVILTLALGVFDLALIGATVAGILAYRKGRQAHQDDDERDPS